MTILENENLAQYATMKIGGIAKRFYIPESIDDLIALTRDIGQDNLLILSGGSNLLINDKKMFEHVVYMRKLDERIIDNSDGRFYCGASVRIQKFLMFINDRNRGGVEYLCSLPAMMGGIIYMNAGLGKKDGFSISDFIQSVYILRGGRELKLEKQECGFAYRKSMFHETRDIILGAEFRFPIQDKKISEKAISERINMCALKQDNSGGNFGSIFSVSNGHIMTLLKRSGVGFRNGVAYSSKSSNWLINKSKGTYGQALVLIKLCRLLHWLSFRKVKLEIVLWR